MNTLSLLLERDLPANQLAFFPLNGKPTYFGELNSKAIAAQLKLRKLGVNPGDSVLLADQLSGDFYATVMAILAVGATVILVEPFLPVIEIDEIISNLKPKVMIASFLGRAWGMRAKAIRQIPHWISASSLCSGNSTGNLQTENVSPDFPGIITFTSGTTGKSKGVVRTHSGLTAQNKAIQSAAQFEQYKKPDLAIFANLVLANLGMGRGTIFVPPKWKSSDLQKIASLPSELQPETLSAGPAFFSKLLQEKTLPHLKSIHIGGALTDCSIFEEGFLRFPESRFIHVYGSSEAEPVAHADAKVAVLKSRERGLHQTLFVGHPVPEISFENSSEGMWVAGEHVCQYYIGNPEENQKTKKTDVQGKVWHFMGDRLEQDSSGFWYQGRSFQSPSDFLLEQKVYSFLGSSASFLFRDSTGALTLSGESLDQSKAEIIKKFPEIQKIQQKKIVRDRRHRARIDRGASK